MSLDDSIDSLLTDTLTVQRFAKGTYVNGIYVPSSPTTISIGAVVQPAFNLSRVIGGADLGSKVDGMHAWDVRVLYTRTLLYTENPGFDPDVIQLDGANWTVQRVSEYKLGTSAVYYQAIITKQTGGAS